jgi:hypothetical protein
LERLWIPSYDDVMLEAWNIPHVDDDIMHDGDLCYPLSPRGNLRRSFSMIHIVDNDPKDDD